MREGLRVTFEQSMEWGDTASYAQVWGKSILNREEQVQRPRGRSVLVMFKKPRKGQGSSRVSQGSEALMQCWVEPAQTGPGVLVVQWCHVRSLKLAVEGEHISQLANVANQGSTSLRAHCRAFTSTPLLVGMVRNLPKLEWEAIRGFWTRKQCDVVSLKQDQCGEEPLAVQEGKEGNRLGRNCCDEVKRG